MHYTALQKIVVGGTSPPQRRLPPIAERLGLCEHPVVISPLTTFVAPWDVAFRGFHVGQRWSVPLGRFLVL